MAKSSNQKQKLLLIARILTQQSDEEHPVSIRALTAQLEQSGIHAERKSIYDDLEALRQSGMDILCRRGPGGGYYLGQRTFELAELKLLVDSIQSSKFITYKKTLALIAKIETLCSRYQASSLQRQIYVSGRVKTMNESIYYNVDRLHAAISDNRQITFQYFQYDRDKRRQLRHGGRRYRVSPYALCWQDENYYLIAYDPQAGEIRHYRVDKMLSIQQTEQPRTGQAAFDALDIRSYSQKTFDMFSGQNETVQLLFHNRLAGVVIDRFGSDVTLYPVDEEHFRLTVEVAVSPRFFAWVFALGQEVQILSPPAVVAQFRRQLDQLAQQYQQET